MSDSAYTKLPILAGGNYHKWQSQIMDHLQSINARLLVNGTEIQPGGSNASTAQRDFIERKEKASSMLRRACGFEARSYIENEYDPVTIWQILREKFASDAAAQPARLQLTMKFSTLRLKPNQSVGEWIAELRQIQNELAGSIAAINDHQIISHVLTHLPSNYKQLKTLISHSKDPAVQTLENIAHEFQLFDAEEKLQNELSGNLSSASTLQKANALSAQQGNYRGRGRSHGNGNWNNNRHHPYNANRESTGNTNDTDEAPKPTRRPAHSDTICYYCLKKGHFQYDCELRKKATSFRQQHHANFAAANNNIINDNRLTDITGDINTKKASFRSYAAMRATCDCDSDNVVYGLCQ